ncbi:hypothetical protein ABT127_21205 [Streptomyces sp. NPDC001904]
MTPSNAVPATVIRGEAPRDPTAEPFTPFPGTPRKTLTVPRPGQHA